MSGMIELDALARRILDKPLSACDIEDMLRLATAKREADRAALLDAHMAYVWDEHPATDIDTVWHAAITTLPTDLHGLTQTTYRAAFIRVVLVDLTRI